MVDWSGGKGYFRLSGEGHAEGERHIAYCNMIWCFLNSYQQNCFNTNRRKQNWAWSAHPVGPSGDRPCIPWVRAYWGVEGTSVWLLSQKFKQNLLRSLWWSSLSQWCMAEKRLKNTTLHHVSLYLVINQFNIHQNICQFSLYWATAMCLTLY